MSDAAARVIRVAALLIDVEAELRRLGLWETEPPGPAALASQQPFCIDTLSFPQWLQFVFLPRMHALVDEDRPLPAKCAIAPMAELYFEGLPLGAPGLIAVLTELDRVIEAGG